MDFAADAVIAARGFTADAWILGTRWTHHRTRDHFGMESDLFVVLSADLAGYLAFTPIHFVLEDMLDRITKLENGDRRRGYITMDAIISGNSFAVDALIFRAGMAGSFTANARIILGGTFTADAWLQGGFTADAFIVGSFT